MDGKNDSPSRRRNPINLNRSSAHESKRRRKNTVKNKKVANCDEEEIDITNIRLDPSNPSHRNRIEQRRRTISHGKNTVGYDEYIKKVPKSERKLYCMETPMTPDPELDIPTRRWKGLIKAWRIALHKYDPPDLMDSKKLSLPEKDDSNISSENNKAVVANGKTHIDSSFSLSEEMLEASKYVIFTKENEQNKNQLLSNILLPNIQNFGQKGNDLQHSNVFNDENDNQFLSDDSSDDDIL